MTEPPSSLSSNRCIVASCTEKSSIIHTGIAKKENIADLLQEQVLSTRHVLTPLCPSHYRQLHRLLHSADKMYTQKRCFTCNAWIHGASRHCPNVKIVQLYFSQNGGTDIPLTNQDYICTTCYNFHLLLVQNTETKSTGVQLRMLFETFLLQQCWRSWHSGMASCQVLNRQEEIDFFTRHWRLPHWTYIYKPYITWCDNSAQPYRLGIEALTFKQTCRCIRYRPWPIVHLRSPWTKFQVIGACAII